MKKTAKKSVAAKAAKSEASITKPKSKKLTLSDLKHYKGGRGSFVKTYAL